jgi:cell division septation protein DedD
VQRRVEKRQLFLLVLLVLTISLISFALGVIVGRNTTEPVIVQQTMESRRVAVVEPVAASVARETVDVEPEEDKLTFYDNLTKEESLPLGSGINLPPDSGQPQVVDELKVPEVPVEQLQAEPTAISAPVPVPEPVAETTVVAETSTTPTSDQDALPAAVKGADWVVQIFSSRSAADAGLLRDKINNKGYPAYIVEADLGKKGIWYRVLFGPYPDKATAVQAQIYADKNDKLKGFVKQR